MAPKGAQQPASLLGTHSIKWLVIDSAPLFQSPLSSLRNSATHYLVTSDVVAELRDKRGRALLDEAKLQLPADTLAEGQEPDEMHRNREGFEVRDPTPESVAKITAFARKTGDLAVLSQADIRVLALCLTLELEENGTWRVRDTPGQVLTGPPKEDKGKKESDAQEQAPGKEEKEDAPVAADAEEAENDALASTLEKLDVQDAKEDLSPAAPPAPAPSIPADTSSASPAASTSALPDAASSPSQPSLADAPAADAAAGGDDDVSDAESDSSAGSWITPDNVHAHKVRDLGLFAAPDQPEASTSSGPAKPKTIMKAAVLTGDFAMQNVALQMGLNVLGSGGKRVREVRTWVLRCHACFKLCKNPEKRFCPSCGGATLLRTSITYVPVSPQHPQGYILHLKSNFNYRLRGTQYSMPNPKMGRAGGAHAEPVVREDQKEWIRGVKSAEVRRDKEQRALQRALLDDQRRGTGSSASMGAAAGAGWFAQEGSLEAQMMGIGGTKGGIDNPKGRRRTGKGGQNGEVRLDKTGLPLIGSGRKNINEARRKKR
ncbi:hypothetical protein Rhopal_000719-T1 [Rhodotorula paludigena]|uniref:20S-pre-rRNA D-site endonuclease NOB1 n=1 Tax=Rhodotorula paludigena TaxID=86838 RepID=A0AAV5GD26_9BASI|nr:hypothetical protein Rhopal_000719-T1 [Rhodotorula paludigena]